MSGFNDDRDRQVVPRWRNFDSALQRGELASHSLSSKPTFTDADVEGLLEDWKQRPSLSVAADLVSACLTLGLDSAIDAAEFVLRKPNSPPAV